MIVIRRETNQLSAIQLHHSGRNATDKGPVVTDKQQGAAELAQRVFQPGNRRDIEMVGGLIQQQDIGLGHQRLGEQNAPLPAARQGIQRLVGIDLVLRENSIDLLI